MAEIKYDTCSPHQSRCCYSKSADRRGGLERSPNSRYSGSVDTCDSSIHSSQYEASHKCTRSIHSRSCDNPIRSGSGTSGTSTRCQARSRTCCCCQTICSWDVYLFEGCCKESASKTLNRSHVGISSASCGYHDACTSCCGFQRCRICARTRALISNHTRTRASIHNSTRIRKH